MANAGNVPRSALGEYIRQHAQKTCNAAGIDVQVYVDADHCTRSFRIEVCAPGRTAHTMVRGDDALRLGLPWTKDVLAAARSVTADAREYAASSLSTALRKAGIHA